MSWLFGRNKSNLPEPTALQVQRTKQIEQLKKFNQNVSEIQRDVEYRVNFVSSGTQLSILITLPPQFPQDKPIVKVTPAVLHPWVNELGQVIGCQGINNFVVQSDLGTEIRKIVDEFQKAPPTLQQNQQFNMSYPSQVPPYPGYPPSTNYGMPGYMPTLPPASVPNPQRPSVSSTTFTTQQLSTGTVGGYKMPDIPNNIQQIQNLSIQELEKLQEDEDRLIEIIQHLPQLQKIAQDREGFCKRNEEKARANLDKKPLLEENKRILLEKYDDLNDVKRKFDENSQKQDELRIQFDPTSIQENLKIAALQAEEEAENIADIFLEGKLSADEFTKKYMERRTLSYLRKAKEERLSSCMVQTQVGY